MDPNDIIDVIVDAIDYAEIAKDPQGLIKARRLLNNDLRQAIDEYVTAEVCKAAEKPAGLEKTPAQAVTAALEKPSPMHMPVRPMAHYENTSRRGDSFGRMAR